MEWAAPILGKKQQNIFASCSFHVTSQQPLTARIVYSILHTYISYSSSKNPILNLTNYNLKILTKILELNVFGTICYILSQQQFSVKKCFLSKKNCDILKNLSQNLLKSTKINQNLSNTFTPRKILKYSVIGELTRRM
jgi:hypothetical protein